MNGEIYSCGSNRHGELGYYSDYSDYTPILVPNFKHLRVTQIAAGTNYSLALSFGDVYYFGDVPKLTKNHGNYNPTKLKAQHKIVSVICSNDNYPTSYILREKEKFYRNILRFEEE